MKSLPGKPKIAVRRPSRTSSAPRDAGRFKPDSTAASPSQGTPKGPAGLQWTFLTNHSHVLIVLSRNPSLVLREVALQVGITERAVQRIVADLEAAGVLEREKIGRQNHYRIRANQPLRHPIESHRSIGDLLSLLSEVPG